MNVYIVIDFHTRSILGVFENWKKAEQFFNELKTDKRSTFIETCEVKE